MTNVNVSAEGVAYALMAIGAAIALLSLAAVFFVSSATWTTLDTEMGLSAGAILLFLSLGVKAIA